jgi:hypothetical protein
MIDILFGVELLEPVYVVEWENDEGELVSFVLSLN